MEIPNFTVEHLKQLPLRAIVAFAARCGRRVEHLAQRAEGDPEREGHRAAIEAALRLAEDFARGSDAAPDPSVLAVIDAVETDAGGPPSGRSAMAAVVGAAHAASAAWDTLRSRRDIRETRPLDDPNETRKYVRAVEHATVDLAALDAFTAAVGAYGAVGYRNEEFVAAALNDYDRLLGLNLGRYPEPGKPIDPSPDGPLGPL